jgi:hypothetical protein
VESKEVYTPLPNETNENVSPHKAIYGKRKSQYEGSKSQGNRFILDNDL